MKELEYFSIEGAIQGQKAKFEASSNYDDREKISRELDKFFLENMKAIWAGKVIP